nr:MAG TPA: hypothetical protein [Bacteriophage sp.]
MCYKKKFVLLRNNLNTYSRGSFGFSGKNSEIDT